MYGITMVLVSLVQTASAQDSCRMTFQVTCTDYVAGDVWTGEVMDEHADSISKNGRMESGGQIVASAPPGTKLVFWANDQQITTVVCTAGYNTQTVRLTRQQLAEPVEVDEDADTGDSGDTDTDDAGDSAEDPPLPDDGVIPEGKAHNVGTGAPARGVQPLWLGNDGDYPTATNPARRGHFISGQRNCPAGKIPLIQGTAATIDGGIPGQIALDDARATACAPPDWDGEYVGSTGTTIIGQDAAGIYCVDPNTITRREPAATAAVIPPPRGDLIVEKLSGPVNLVVGGEGNFTATVRNTGNAAVPASHLQFQVDGVKLDEVVVPALAAGEGVEVKSATWKGTSPGLHTPSAIADNRKEVPEANEWDNDRDSVLDVAAPPSVAASPRFKLIERWGPFGALIRNESEDGDLLYVHGVGGAFVTFNLYKDRIGFEPYVAVGGDGESTHPCEYNTQGELTECSGWYPSIYWGARVPVRLVNVWKFQFFAFAGVGVVQDDINLGFHSWGQMTQYTGGLEVRFVGIKSFKPAFSLEAGGSTVSYLNGSLTHTTGGAWVIAPNLKVGF